MVGACDNFHIIHIVHYHSYEQNYRANVREFMASDIIYNIGRNHIDIARQELYISATVYNVGNSRQFFICFLV